MRILLSRGIAGIDERTRGLTQRWLDMVDWRAANIRDASLSFSRSLDPARAWVERQERAPTANMSLPAPTAHECANHLAQLATELRQEAVATAMDSNWRIADPSKYLQQVCRELARLLSRAEVRGESARLLAKHIGDRLPPGWGAVWTDKGCSALTGTSDERATPKGSALPARNGDQMRAVPSTANRNMPTMSHRMVHAMPASRSGV